MSFSSLALSELKRLARLQKNRKSPFVKSQRVVSKKEAQDNKLLTLTVKEYAERFFVSESTVRYRINKRKIQSFKNKGRVFVVIPAESKTGLEYAY